MAHIPSLTGDQFHASPESTVGSDSSTFHVLIDHVSQLNLVRDLLQHQAEQSQAAQASEAFTSSNLAIEGENNDAIVHDHLAIELDPDFNPNHGFEFGGRDWEGQRQRLIAILEHERRTSTPPITTIHNFPDQEANIFDDGGITFSMNEWDFTYGTAASETVIERLPSVALREEDHHVDKNEEEGLCSICMEEMKIGEEAKQLPCVHRYHGECIKAWLKIKNTCPICRYELPKH